MRRNKFAKFLGKMFRTVWFVIKGLFKWFFVGLPRTLKLAVKYAKDPSESGKVNRELEAGKRLDVHSERIERVERLVYSVYKDPEYSKSEKGQHDLKILKEKVK